MVAPIKIKTVEELTEKLRNSRGVLFATHEGLTGNQAVMFRRLMREKGLVYLVRKNTLSRLAMTNAGFAEGLPLLTRSTAIIISESTAEAPFQAFFGSLKEYEALKVKGGIYEGVVVDAKVAEAIAKLGTKEEVLSVFLGTLKAPIGKLASLLSAMLQKLVGTLDAVRASKES